MPEKRNRQWDHALMHCPLVQLCTAWAQGTFAAAATWHQPGDSPSPSPCRTGCPEPGLEQKMVYFRMMPLGLAGGSQDTTTLLAEDGTALMPAGGPGTGEGRNEAELVLGGL